MSYQTIYYWPDKEWCFKDDRKHYSYRDDDYGTRDVPCNMTYRQIDALVNLLVYFRKLNMTY